MNFKAQFLTQYRGDTKQAVKVTDRFGWATIEVEIEPYSAQDFRPVLRRVGRSGFADHVYHDGSSFWAEVDSVNLSRRGDVGSLGSFGKYWWGSNVEGLKNFQPREQQRFFWNAFGICFFDRLPVRHFYTLWPSKVKNYRPGKVVMWDETALIGKKYADYLHQNLCVVDDIVLCRIERPCFTAKRESWRDIEVFTPYGGFGDPVLDFAALERDTYDPAFMRSSHWQWMISEGEIAEIDDRGTDPIARTVRAVYMDLFRQKSWLGEQKKITKAKAAKKVAALHDIWKQKGSSVEDGHLERVTEILLGIAENGPVRDILDGWENRTISL
ncbi:hypothetical protein OIU34_20425 [Pararhizobium sp. BT-229]|uniref:hypothetical protein n=1 Tax=Pararhizobium sp. BT-229 TaxID=2986923 RepID=UPI0021F7A58B|nr:hypothetical protein [Pararhizobium sp. BT-229]MCV9964255.1 hypothetical protein [Pararhizobium sp. BT-229]